MGQATATSAKANDLKSLHLQLKKDGKFYYDNPGSEEAHERLLHTLQINDCREIITAAVDGDDLANAFVLAGAQGHVDLLNAFLNHGMNVDVKNNSGWTALIDASCNGHEECVQFLLEDNATVDVQNKEGHTALMYANQRGKSKIVEMLLEKNANPNIQDNRGVTVLMWASRFNGREAVQALLNHGADIELKNNDGKTALDLALNEGIKEMIRNHVPTSYVLK